MLYEVIHAAVEVLMARVEDNPFSEWAGLAAELVRAAMTCQGTLPLLRSCVFFSSLCVPAFTAEQMSKLSDILEAALPPATSSPPASHIAIPNLLSPASTFTPPLQRSRKYNVTNENTAPYGDLAKEFGVDAQIVEALAQRLSQFP